MSIERTLSLFREANPVLDDTEIEMPFDDGVSFLASLEANDHAPATETIRVANTAKWQRVAIAAASFAAVLGLGAIALVMRSPEERPPASTVTSLEPTTTTAPAPDTTTPTGDPLLAVTAVGEAFADAWNARDYGRLTSLFVDDNPEIRLLNSADANTLVWTADEIEQDMAFGAILGETWEFQGCRIEFGRAACEYLMADEFSRRIDLDLIPVSIFFDESTGRLGNATTNMVAVFSGYHDIMQEYGRWYTLNYPNEAAIAIDIIGLGGDPPRAWNFTDLSAAERILARLDEWIATPGFIPPPGA